MKERPILFSDHESDKQAELAEKDRRIKQLETFGICSKCGAYVFGHEVCDKCGTTATPAVIEIVLVEKDRQIAALTSELDQWKKREFY